MEVTDKLLSAAAESTVMGENLKMDCQEAINSFKETMEANNNTIKEYRT